MEERIDKSLLVGHKVIDPILFGWSKEGNALSNTADQLRTAHEAYQVRYAEPNQEKFEDVFNKIIAVNGLPQVLEIKPLKPIEAQLTSATMEANLTQDEIRERMGLEPIEGVTLNPVAEAIGSLSPLVATKVLDNMTLSEIRELVGLEAVQNVERRTETTSKEFNKEEVEQAFLDHFENCGVDQDKYEVLWVKQIQCEDLDQFRKIHNETFAAIEGLDANDISVLGIIDENPLATPKEISDATNIPEPEVNDILEKLDRAGAVEVEEIDGQTERNVTEDGKDSIEAADEPQLQLKYRYALRSDAPPLKTRSRDFCIRLMAARKLYTKDEIDSPELRNGMKGFNADVFRYRGGYYNNPNGRTTPWCRHIWEQVIVRERN
jgi:DNA-binding Lrp family transcriptional regulator